MYSFELENENGEIVNINDEEKYVVVGCSGLEPPAATLFTAKSANRKGVKHNGSTLNERNITLQIKLLGNIEENRNNLYSWLDTEQYAKVRYKNGLKKVYCEGYVQDHSNDFFTSNEVVSVSIVCGNPYWIDLAEIAAEISNVVKQFKFPFSIDDEGIPLSTYSDNMETSIYNGGAETGCIIRIFCEGDISNLTIYDAKNTTRKFDIKTTLEKWWTVEINSDRSPKTCKAIKQDGTEQNLMKYVRNPTWFNLRKGENVFSYTAESGVENAQITISFTNKYLGV